MFKILAELAKVHPIRVTDVPVEIRDSVRVQYGKNIVSIATSAQLSGTLNASSSSSSSSFTLLPPRPPPNPPTPPLLPPPPPFLFPLLLLPSLQKMMS